MLNFLHLFVSPPESNVLYTGFYDPVLVGLSIFVAILASYASLLVSHHVSMISIARTRGLWIAMGGVCFGLGIWAMHFVGMLAFSLPCDSRYDPATTLLSVIPAILASMLAIKIISRHKISRMQLLAGGLLLGVGIGAMHYSGMAAMHLNGLIRYDVKLFFLSIGVAIVLATLALWIKFRLNTLFDRWRSGATVASAMVMGLAVSGMHYTAMASAYFIRGDNAVTSGMAPSFLAAIVLVATGLIIVVTLVAVYFGKYREFSIAGAYKFPALLLIVWVFISWLSVDHYYGHLADELFVHESQRANQRLGDITGNITESLKLLKGAAQVLSRDTDTLRVLRSFGDAPSTLSDENRKQRWSHDRTLISLSHSLAYASTHLGADMILVLNAAGECIASSNAEKPNSVVGLNLADRGYFQQAKAGQEGSQYAVGRATNIPGLFFSSPVFDSGRFVGAVVVKRDVSKLAFWTKQESVCIADVNGVIVMAPDKQFELRYMPDAPAARMSVKDKMLLYKRSELEPLKLTPWGSNPAIVLVENNFPPVVFASKTLAENAITVYVHSSLSELVRFGAEKFWLFFLLAIAGSMLIIAVAAVVIFLRESRKLNAELRIAASAFESEEGVMVTDASNVILRVNRAFTVITGYSAEDAIGKTPRMLRSGRHDADFFVMMWRSIVQTGTWEGELWNRRKNGVEYPEHLIITAVKDNRGQVINYVASFNDITRRIQIETDLQNSYQQMYSLLNSMAEGAYGVDINGNCTFVNRSFLRILGYEQEDEIIGRHIHELIHHSHPDGRCYPALECQMYRAYRQNQEVHVTDEVFWRRDGCAVPVEYWSQPILIDGAVQGAIATFIDVAERKQLEDALKESELRYRTVADFTSDWEYWILPDNTFRYISPACEQISGYTPDEFYADPSLLTQVVYPDDLPLYTGHIHHVSEQGQAEPIDFRIYTKQGEIRWISHLCRPVYDAAGHYLGQRAGNRDISDRKEAEEQIRNLAFYDTLTQLPNRRLLKDRLGRAMADSCRSGRYGALMFLDLDNFKPINDQYGHGAGDLLLIEVAQRLSRCVREIDTVARFGGDEFVVMLSKLDISRAESTVQAGLVAEKIRTLLAEPYILTLRQDGKTDSAVAHRCTSSIGVVLFINHEYSMEEICKWADMAMYQAKEDGRDIIRFFEPKIGAAQMADPDVMALHLNWHDAYACGEPTIDQEHRKLFDLANALIEQAYLRKENPRGFELALEKLLEHVVQHFNDEEAILARYHYADLAEHARAHKALLARALQLRTEIESGGVTLGELVSFLADEVVAQHMLKEDRKFFSVFGRISADI